MPENNSILVFRKRLLAYSETFIADQGHFLPSMNSVFCGFQWETSGRFMLEDDVCLVLDDYAVSFNLSKLRLRSGLGCNRKWLSSIKQHNPALIHAHFLKDGSEALNLARNLSIPTITTLHGHDITKTKFSASKLRDFFDRVDSVIAVSDFIAECAIRRGCPESKLTQHYIGIDLDRFTQQKNESPHPSLLFVGRLVEKKGCIYLLRAMQILKKRFPDLELTIVGDGPLRPALEAESKELGLSATFAGQKNAAQIRDMLSSHWVFVAPSITAENGDTEGLGMVFLEAQAMATPVVSFASGGVVEAVEHGVTGLLCEEKDVQELASNIDLLLSDASLRTSIGVAGKQRVNEKFNIRRQCEILEHHYQSVLSG